MATFVFTDARFECNSVDLSDHVKTATLDIGAETQDDTVMGDDTRSVAGGLKTWSMSIEFLQDYASAKVDATVFPLLGTTTTIKLRPVDTTVSGTNPEYNGTAVLESYTPMGGSVGDMATAAATWVAAGSLTRSTS